MNLYPIGKVITYALMRLCFSVRYEGLEHIPSAGGYILASNHRSNFDPVLIAHKIPPQVHYLAKEELLRNAFIGTIIKSLGIIPIKRGSGDTTALDNAAQVIHDGGVLGMFPEGHRSKDGKPLRPRSGIALIAGQTGAHILPCAVCYGEKLRFRTRVTIRYGALISHPELGVQLDAPSTIRGASRQIMDRIVGLLETDSKPQLPS